jgi:hypothetical protein
VTAASNAGGYPRSGAVTFTSTTVDAAGKTVSATFAVTQTGPKIIPKITLSQTTLDAPLAGGVIGVQVTVNTGTWAVAVSDSTWLAAAPAGDTGKVLAVGVRSNETCSDDQKFGMAKTGTITVTSSEKDPSGKPVTATITVTQPGLTGCWRISLNDPNAPMTTTCQGNPDYRPGGDGPAIICRSCTYDYYGHKLFCG